MLATSCNTPTRYRCVLIGSESLLAQCAETLQQAGHDVVAVVTARASLQRWATGRGLRVLRDPAALVSAEDLRPFDYLFSVTNLSVLAPAVIRLPARAAINFHDGPLPDLAGLNTPVWALLEGRAQHGIAWHLMTEDVDQGDILVERRFDIGADETALSLNTRCFEAGIAGFETLVAGLGDGSLSPRSQGSAPKKYFGRKDRPAAACSIDWTADASSIATLVRALDFGVYANPIGAAKAAYQGHLLIAVQAQAREASSVLPPGTVVSVSAQGVAVAAGRGEILLTRLATLDGRSLSAEEATRNFGLRPGARFMLLSSSQATQLTAANAALCGHEPYWLRRLETTAPMELPYIDRSAAPAVPRYEFLDAPGLAGCADEFLCAALAYLARLADKGEFDVGFADPTFAAVVGEAGAWFASQVPLHASIDFSRGFSSLRSTMFAGLAEVRRRGTYLCDLVSRSPDLRALAASRDPRVLPVSLILVDDLVATRPISGSELTIAIAIDGSSSRWWFDAAKLEPSTIAEMQTHLATLWQAVRHDEDRPLAGLPLLTDVQRQRVLGDWNQTISGAASEACVHRLIEAQAARAGDRPAITCEGRSLSYRELDARANQLARRLASQGVGPDVLVGLYIERSIELMVGLLAIHKAGGAYVPLDPSYPKDRLAYMVEDSKLAVLLTQQSLLSDLPHHNASVICLDRDWPRIAVESTDCFDGDARPQHLAYVIYTSGSTGKPKGVMVEHRNVVNFFGGMDLKIGTDDPGTWLAVTSLSFDISVLELCWTLTRGFHVLMSSDEDRSDMTQARGAHAHKPLDFSLFYFSSDESEGSSDKYKLLLEGAKYGDMNGFAAVWTPERHFHAFGGLYPNPAVTGAAIAAVTERVQIRAGSVVLPLHHPLRVTEEWSVVDNISKGRVGISFAAGWQPNDFVLRPENFADNKNVMLRDIETVRRLWRGEALPFEGPLGKMVEVKTLPRPVQKELPYWVTSAGNPETFVAAGRIGANVLTHLLGQTVEELRDKLAAYRKAWTDAGHAGQGYVSLMLHSFVGPDPAQVRDKVRQPLIEYLRSSLNLVKQYAWSFPAFKRREGMDSSPSAVDLSSLSTEEMDALLEHSFERYYETSGLFGTPEGCLTMIDSIKAIGVDDVACLIDFGVDSSSVLAHLPYLNELRRLSMPTRAVSVDHTPAGLLRRHVVTHLQCTPSMARMLVMDETARQGLEPLRRIMIGGEAFPPTLARDLKGLLKDGEVMNMYGPTETTIWSATHVVDTADQVIPLGRPLANQMMYVLDSRQQPVPVGVPGELVIGGRGVVRGYLRRPELTAERFLPHPFDSAAGRVYRTGDLARQRPDGVVEFLGRLDHQVKVRGYRIELGEIEASLLTHAGLREAVVMAREDVPGDLRLVAYVVPAGAEAPSSAELREYLRGRLPDYMVPAHFLAMSSLPQTPNGKIDRKALPTPGHSATKATDEPFVAPAGDLEEQIADIWKNVLKLQQVGTRDNFFDLGGHSLLAVQMHRQLREALGRDLSITDIFRFPTIHSLSTYLGDANAEGAAARQGVDRAQGRRAALKRRQGLRADATADSLR